MKNYLCEFIKYIQLNFDNLQASIDKGMSWDDIESEFKCALVKRNQWEVLFEKFIIDLNIYFEVAKTLQQVSLTDINFK